MKRPSLILISLSLLTILAASCYRPAYPQPVSTVVSFSGKTALKLVLPQSGMYELTVAELRSLGNVKPSCLHLFYQGREQPLWAQSEGQGSSLTLRFYGQAGSSLYTRESVYWLQAGEGAAHQMEERSVEPALREVVDRYTATVHAEENLVYFPQARGNEHWFWHNLPAPQSVTFPVTLTAVAPGPGRLTLDVWGSTGGAQSPNHHLRVWVNGQRVADEAWGGQGQHVITGEVPSGVWVEGVNQVKIEAPGDTGVPADMVLVNSIDAAYPRLLAAQSDRLEFDSPGGLVQLTGFGGPVAVFDITQPERVTRLAESSVQQQQGKALAATERGRRYAAVGPKGWRRPLRVVPAALEPDLRALGLGADYVAIGPADLLEPLQPLLRYRESQGFKTTAVPVEAIYDQFNHGLPEPDAIRAFLSYAARSYQPLPQYVVLVGDATYDPKGYVSPPEANRLPTFFVFTVYGGETASDVAFAQLDGEKPALAIGRIPARDAQQVKTLVAKTLAYEQKAPAGEWRRRVLAIADGQEASFRGDARAFLDHLPGYPSTLYSPEAGAANIHQQVKRYVDEGYWLIAYFGHGSINQWGKDRIFTATDVSSLANGNRLPIVVNMTCLTGLFTHPKVTSLTETLLWLPEGGAAAALAPTSLTLANDQSLLSDAVAHVLMDDPNARLGQILLRAQRQALLEDQGARDVMQTFLLFGDPALKLIAATP